jgi:hypothetical protein
MGWWGTDIMDGDYPLDVQGNLADICGLKFDSEQGYCWSPELLNIYATKILEAVEAEYDTIIAMQVWARLVMEHGARMTDDMRTLFVWACAEDEWAREASERKQRIDAFRKRIEEYDGTVNKFHDLGLFGTIELKMNGVKPEAFAEGECPVCKNGTIEETEDEFRCRGECGHTFPKKPHAGGLINEAGP